ncbi:hypothetical protein GIB67_023981 [Kingdonia uniflora]|uniref:Uncharacterized protein n=1 Tax=Kingdonia uniflora TaxID=39325 RepID=A0A7J7LPE4_9MAGN|nr:hypothetical protein GIB67_023981 [Kingdonia uniflora]
MGSGKDASVLESRTVHARGNKCQLHEREKINCSSLSPNNRLESKQRERRKIKGINQELFEDDKRLKRAKGSGSRWWEYSSVVRRNLDSSADSHPNIEASRTWNDNIIWVKGNCLHRDDEELLDLRFRSVKQSVKSTVERKESLLDEVAEGVTELKLVLGELGLSRKKRVESKSKMVAKAQSTWSITGVDEGTRQTSGEKIQDKTPRLGSCLPCQGDLAWYRRTGIRAQKSLARAKTDTLKEIKQLKTAHAVAIGQLQVVAKANLDETVEERDRLGHHLRLKGYSQEEVDAIKADTYAEDEEGEAKMVGFVDGLDGISPQTVLDNQGDDIELPVDGSEKEIKEISLRINDLESGLVREIETSKALLSAQVEFQVRFEIGCLIFVLYQRQVKCDGLNERVARLKAERDQVIARAKKVEARERSGGSRTTIKAHLDQGDIRGNTDLKECQHRLDAALIREKILEGEIRAKDLLVKRKDELLKDLPAREELKTELRMLRARVVELQAMSLAESEQYIAKLKEDAIRYDRIDADRNAWKDTYVIVKVHHERLKARFAKVVVPEVARFDLLKVFVAYFVEEVKRLKSE